MNQMMNDDPLDPKLLKKLESLRELPQRDPDAAAKSQARFLAELDDLFPVGINVEPSRHRYSVVSVVHKLKETLTMKTFAYRTALTTVGIAIFIMVFLFGGTSAVARAAQGALPGDALYPVKTSLEQARLSLASEAKDQAELYLELANRRLNEMEALAEVGRFEQIGPLGEQYRVYADKALAATAALAQTDPGLAAQLNTEINQSLSRFAQVLNKIASQNPGVTAPGSELPGGSPAGNENGAIGNANENNANEAAGNGNGNDANNNANGNGDDSNSNGNDDSANANGDDSNGNGNDDNTNANDDDSNGNDNSANGNDDSANGNDDDRNGNDDRANDNGDDSNSNDDSGNDDSNSNDDSGNDDSSGGNDNGGRDDNGGGGDDDSGSGKGGGNDDGGGDDDSGSGKGGGDDDSSGGDDTSRGSLGGQLLVLILTWM